MSRQFYQLPSLNALATFEAVCRHHSLTLAASELGVTPGAVSRQIKALETELGVRLLNRNSHNVSYTDAGKILFDSLALSFANLGNAVNKITDSDDELTFSLGATTAFSSLWLMPRLNQFWKKYPQIRINHNLSDDLNGFHNESVDVSIQYAEKNNDDNNRIFLFDDLIYPICSPTLAPKYPHINSVEDLGELPLLQLNHHQSNWTDWAGWFGQLNLPIELQHVSAYNNYIIALQAAQDGQGVLLGWHRLVEPLIQRQALCKLLDVTVKSSGAYYLYIHSPLNQGAELFKQWLLDLNLA